MKKLLITGAATLIAFSPTIIFAAIVNCGGADKACTIEDLWGTIRGAYYLAAQIITLFAFGVFCYYLIKYGWSQDKVRARTELKQRSWQILLGVAALWSLIPLTFLLLKVLGVRDDFVNPIKPLNGGNTTGFLLVEHAYAADTNNLSPIDLSKGPYEYFLVLFGAFMRFFVYPALIALWVYSGFLLVYARGMPEKLKEAHNWLWFTVIITAILLVAQAFMYAVRDTVNSIVS